MTERRIYLRFNKGDFDVRDAFTVVTDEIEEVMGKCDHVNRWEIEVLEKHYSDNCGLSVLVDLKDSTPSPADTLAELSKSLRYGIETTVAKNSNPVPDTKLIEEVSTDIPPKEGLNEDVDLAKVIIKDLGFVKTFVTPEGLTVFEYGEDEDWTSFISIDDLDQLKEFMKGVEQCYKAFKKQVS